MIKLLKLLVLLPVMVLPVSCSNEDEPVVPDLKGEVENGFFTNLITSAETRYFEEYCVAAYIKPDTESKWKLDDELKLGGTGRMNFLFYHGCLYFAARISPLDYPEGFDYLKLLYGVLIDDKVNVPNLFVSSTLTYDQETGKLSYDRYTTRRSVNVISASGDKFRLSFESDYTSSEGDGRTLSIYDYVETDRYSEHDLNKAKFFNSWKEVAYYLVDLAAETYGEDYKLYGVGPSLNEIRAFYSTEQFDAE